MGWELPVTVAASPSPCLSVIGEIVGVLIVFVLDVVNEHSQAKQ